MQRPLVIVAMLFIMGLIMGTTIPLLGGWTALLTALGCAALGAHAIRARSLDVGSRWLLLVALPLGVWSGARTEMHHREALASLAPLHEGEVVTIRGELSEEPRFGQSSVMLVLSSAIIEGHDGVRVSALEPVDVQLVGDANEEFDCGAAMRGDLIRAEGFFSGQGMARNPGGFDRQSWQWQRRVAGSITVTLSHVISVERGKSGTLAYALRAARCARMSIAAALELQQGPEASSFTRAALLGDRVQMDPSDRQAFLLTGLGHLFAVSGLHVAIVYGITLGGLRLLRFPWRLSLGLSLALMIPFVALIGFRVSAVRAVILIAAIVAGRLIGRTVDMLSGLALAAIALCAWDPRAPWQPGFQMSFLAVLALTLWAPAVRDLTQVREGDSRAVRFLRGAVGPALLLVALQLALLPLMAEHYRLWSWVALPMNLLLVPLTGLVLFGSVAGLLVGLAWPWLGAVIGHSTGGIIEMMFEIVRLVAGWPGAASSLSPFPWWAAGLWFALILCTPAVVKARGPDEILRRRAHWIISWAALLALAIWVPLLGSSAGRLRVTFLDVGQGDSTLIEMPSGAVVVVDGGRREPRDMGLSVVEPALRARGASRIDLMVATHGDSDHIGGLVHLLGRFPVKWVAGGDQDGATRTLDDFRRAQSISGAERLRLVRGMTIRDGLAEIRVLHPDPSHIPADSNDRSIVLDIRFGDASVSLMGDAEMPAEQRVLAACEDLECDVIRTGHHGSRNATDAALLEAMTPALGVISVGQSNPYGHPAPEVIQRLEEANARTLRTDRCGAITLETDGRTIWVWTAQGEAL